MLKVSINRRAQWNHTHTYMDLYSFKKYFKFNKTCVSSSFYKRQLGLQRGTIDRCFQSSVAQNYQQSCRQCFYLHCRQGFLRAVDSSFSENYRQAFIESRIFQKYESLSTTDIICISIELSTVLGVLLHKQIVKTLLLSIV